MAILLLSLLFSNVHGQQTSCGYRDRAGPASTTDGQITLLSMDGRRYAPGCPGKLYVDDQTNNFGPTIVNRGHLTVKFGTCNIAFNNGAELWVDWTNTGTFSKNVNSVGSWVGTTTPAGVDYTFTINVPPGTTIGPKRARITMEEGVTPPLDPCVQFSYGSTIDFTLVVLGAPIGGLPAALSVDPTSGPSAGGNTVLVRGANLTDEAGNMRPLRYAFGRTISAPARWVFAPDTIECVAPPGSGQVLVVPMLDMGDNLNATNVHLPYAKSDVFYSYV